ncbi:MAG: RluA family pseudouridine synthase [Bacteroidales bacterium]|nr:RluA family pseudouridine synthase [Bacteroidales bacterium]
MKPEENNTFEIHNDETPDLHEHYNLTVDKGQSLLRIDKYIQTKIENATRNKIQESVKAGKVLVNEQVVKSNYKVKPLDNIQIFFDNPPREVEIIPQDIPIEIVYEDNDILVVNKPAGMVVHPAYSNYDGTLLNALTYHLSKDDLEKPKTPFLVHRIDKDTSGILLIAKSDIMHARLAQQFFDHSIERKYIALTWGDFKEDNGTIRGNIARCPKDRRVMCIFDEGGEIGKHAVTHYKVVERFGYISAIECQLETGRTHQIRAHLKHIGHPLFNDATYGGNSVLKGTTFTKYKQFVQNCFKMIPRQSLHAKSLRFIHPRTNKEMFFNSELPEDMQSVMDKWRAYGENGI